MAEEADEFVERVAKSLHRTGLTVATAESLTGGGLSARFACGPGASDWFRGGVVAYSADVKHKVLGVPPGPVVSEIAATAMARGVARLLESDIGVAVTGVGGPGPEEGCEAGTVWIALHHGPTTKTRLEHLAGGPEEVVDATRDLAIRWLAEHLDEVADG